MDSSELAMKAFYILEVDNNDDILWSWIYPVICPEEEIILNYKCKQFFQNISFVFFRRINLWYYVLNKKNIQFNSLQHIKYFILIVKATEYNPDKYKKICDLLSQNVDDPVQVQKLFLEIYTGKNFNSNDNGFLQIKEHLKLKTIGNLKDLIKIFELETILIYNALLLKKRVIIYHQSLKELIKYMKAIPSLLVHRIPSDYLYPFIEDNPDEILQLKSSKWFVAGTTSKTLLSNVDLFDLIVNIPETNIEISPSAKESFIMTKTHKEIALLMVQLSEDVSVTDANIESALREKTDAILTQLKSLATIQTDSSAEKMISLEYLRSKKFSTAIENFLFNLALAENIMIL